MSERSGFSRSAIYAWESGHAMPNAEALAALARCYRVSADYLLGLTDHPEGLRPGVHVVDEDRRRALLDATSPDQVKRLRLPGADRLAFVQRIPGRPRVMSEAEYLAAEKEVLAHLRSIGYPLEESQE